MGVMRPCVQPPLLIRNVAFGGPKPLFCVPLVGRDAEQLISQARVAHSLKPDVVEWRADSYDSINPQNVLSATSSLREVLDSEPIIFTLRIHSEGGAKAMAQNARLEVIESVLRSGPVDIVDLELSNGPEVLKPLIRSAHEHGTRVILSFHDFESTPGNDVLLERISTMVAEGADIAKIACMPNEPSDVLRLLQVTLSARQTFPGVPLCTMSMGRLGSLTRVAGFLYGCDMAFAVGQEASAPGQIPINDARAMAESLMRYA
jgi:3-dehydroquinate dehydratase-1